MTLLDAQQYDEARSRRRRNMIIAGIVVVLILAWVAYHLRNYPERHAVDKFLTALQQNKTEAAYGILMSDPNWKQHPEKYSKYAYVWVDNSDKSIHASPDVIDCGNWWGWLTE